MGRGGNHVTSVTSDRISPALGGVPETLLIPLWARALEQSQSEPIITDPDAVRIVAALDYDFDKFKRKRVEGENFCVRSRVMDDVIRSVLRASPGTPVVEFGPGLDTRGLRLGSDASHWFEVDLPEVIELREQFIPGDKTRTLVPSSMLDTDWHSNLTQGCSPPLFIAEGVFYFFSAEQIQDLFFTIQQKWPGASFVFDAISSWYLKASNWRHPLSDSSMQFSLSAHAEELPAWGPGISVKRYVGYGDQPEYDAVMHRFARWKRLAARYIPIARHAFMIVHAGLDAATEGNYGN